jgi:hypothetical protein
VSLLWNSVGGVWASKVGLSWARIASLRFLSLFSRLCNSSRRLLAGFILVKDLKLISSFTTPSPCYFRLFFRHLHSNF